MTLKIKKIVNKSVYEKERIVLFVIRDIDVGEYAVFKSSITKGSPYPGDQLAYWFPDQAVEAGDQVVLYSKGGSPSKKKLENGGTAYFFYWDRDNALWDSDGYAPVLLHVKSWNVFQDKK